VASGRDLVTFTGVVLFASLGFALGAGGSAYRSRSDRAEPYRKMRVEHEGLSGAATRTRVLFQNPGLPLQAVELSRDREGLPTRGQVALRDGEIIAVLYDGAKRPSALEGADGARAELAYESERLRVSFTGAGGEALGEHRVAVPAELRPALRMASLEAGTPSERESALASFVALFVGEAHAQAAQPEAVDETIGASRDLPVGLDVRLSGAKTEPGRARVEAKCAPLSCLAEPREIDTPGQAQVSVAVLGNVKKSTLGAAPDPSALGDFEKAARAERKQARKVLPDVAAAVAAVGATSIACRALGLELSVCAPGMGKASKPAGAAVVALVEAEVPESGAIVDERALALYFEDRARASLDKPARIELCLARDGYADACTSIDARPFAEEAPAAVERALTMKRRVGGNAAGSFVITQSDGPDCSFSPSPRTRGPIRIAVDGEKGVISASLTADERGSRPNLGCSLGTANMSWTQTYTISATQTLSREQLERGGPIPLRMSGHMNGAGSYSFSNCRSSGGASASCPGGKRDSYAYPVELTGQLDLERGVGNGMIVVRARRSAPAAPGRCPGRSCREPRALRFVAEPTGAGDPSASAAAARAASTSERRRRPRLHLARRARARHRRRHRLLSSVAGRLR
jgi:hypothetical protein